jgi:hypothetical protein
MTRKERQTKLYALTSAERANAIQLLPQALSSRSQWDAAYHIQTNTIC